MDLSLKYQNTVFNVEIFGDFVGLFWSGGDITFLNKNTESSHDLLALILVKIEEPFDIKGKSFVEYGFEHFREHFY